MSCDRGHAATRLRKAIEKSTRTAMPPQAFCNTPGNPNDPAVIPPLEAALAAERMFHRLGVNPANELEVAVLIEDIRENRLQITRKHKHVMFNAPELMQPARPKIGDPSTNCDCKDCEYVGTDCCGNPTPYCETSSDSEVTVCTEGFGCAPSAEERYAQYAAEEDAYINSAEGQAFLEKSARDNENQYTASLISEPAPAAKTYEERKKEEAAADNPYIKDAMAETGLSRAVVKRVLRDEKTRVSLQSKKDAASGAEPLSQEQIAEAARRNLTEAARKEASSAEEKAAVKAKFNEGSTRVANFITSNPDTLTKDDVYSVDLRAGDITRFDGAVILGVKRATGGKTNVTYRRRDGQVITTSWNSHTKIAVRRPTTPETRQAALDLHVTPDTD